MTQQQAFRASLLYFTDDPLTNPDGLRWHTDGLLIVTDGLVVAAGDFDQLQSRLAQDVVIQHFPGKIIMPGLIDSHIHYPQTDMIASPAEGLLPWLEHYTFPTENRFKQTTHAHEVAGFFLDELLRNGTTTAMVYSSVHPESVDAFFEQSAQRRTRMIAGKVLMDRNCPEFLQDTAEGGVADSEALIQRWHQRERQLYAITPRFAITSSPEQLQLAGELAARYPDTFVQTHVAENRAECEWARSLFPQARSYLDIYDQFGLMKPRAMFGHCIWLDQEDRARMAATQSVAAVCPTSNLFLGSGLFDFDLADQATMPMALASDVGGGTSFSMLRTMSEAYKVARMGGFYLPASRLFYLCTLGAARGLQLADKIGHFAENTEADFIVLDPKVTPLLARRTAQTENIEELLFVLLMLGDDRCIHQTYVEGRPV